jgi:tetratricopeptide (TPR) repeat protein
MTGELPSSLEGMNAAAKLKWLWRARRHADQLTLLAAELVLPGNTPADRFELRIAQCDALRRLGRVTEAKDAARAAEDIANRLSGEFEFEPAEKDRRLALVLTRLGRVDEAIAAARRVINFYPTETLGADRRVAQLALAELYADAGRPRECIELLGQLLRVPTRNLSVPALRVDPAWDYVREDPAFKPLLADPKNSEPL